jgi:hypothetical protein
MTRSQAISAAPLTTPQREFLVRVAKETFSDNSGRGLLLYDGNDVRMAKRLLEKGLVTNALMMPFCGPKITEAGRAALQPEKTP